MTILSRQIGFILFTLVSVVIFDQVTKEFVIHTIPGSQHAGKDHTFFYFTHERNPGLVIGIFSQYPQITRFAPIAATLVLLYIYRQLEPASRLQSFTFGLVFGGAIGNIIDRFTRDGTVIDFLQFNFYFLKKIINLPTTRYPAFNIADSAICVGIGLLIFTWHKISRIQVSDASRSS